MTILVRVTTNNMTIHIPPVIARSPELVEGRQSNPFPLVIAKNVVTTQSILSYIIKKPPDIHKIASLHSQ
ncbi:MAG: hypothetical protein Q8O99_05100 [bacterium]|nr:hypothetical protein [bacterium]